jgi:hypothetical protein
MQSLRTIRPEKTILNVVASCNHPVTSDTSRRPEAKLPAPRQVFFLPRPQEWTAKNNDRMPKLILTGWSGLGLSPL